MNMVGGAWWQWHRLRLPQSWTLVCSRENNKPTVSRAATLLALAQQPPWLRQGPRTIPSLPPPPPRSARLPLLRLLCLAGVK